MRTPYVQDWHDMENSSSNEHLDLVKLCGQEMSKYFNGAPMLNSIIENSRELDRLGELHEKGERWNEMDKALLIPLRQNIACLEHICNSWLNTGHYGDIPDRLRLLYAFVCALRAKLENLCGNHLASLNACDQGLLKGNDLEDGSLSRFASFLCGHILPPPQEIHEKFQLKAPAPPPPPLPNSVQIPVMELPALDIFYTKFFLPQQPLIIRGMVNGWPASEKWSFSYLNSICGHRLVPVELGSKYTDEDWRQQLMTFHRYLSEFVFPAEAEEEKKPTSSPLGYLAQHRLLDQVPELFADLAIPDYCAFGQNELDEEGGGGRGGVDGHEEAEECTVNVFIGPTGTVSPLHTDPRHNMFCQIRGRKFVRLISPEERDRLYLYDDLMRRNTSQVNVESPDSAKFPKFGQVKCHDFVMEAGECLFIPRGWFHHVRALTPSISVSIWFGKSHNKVGEEGEGAIHR